MATTITGRIIEVDQWRRIRVVFPAYHREDHRDVLNTELILRAYDRRNAVTGGWSPLSRQSYLAKLDEKCFAYDTDGRRVGDFSKCVGRIAEFEVDMMPFAGDRNSHDNRKGWFIKVDGIRLC